MRELVWVAVAAVALGAIGLARFAARGERRLGTDAQRTAGETLRTANELALAVRNGLPASSAGRAGAHLRVLMDMPTVALADLAGVVSAEHLDDEHRELLEPVLTRAIATGTAQVVTARTLACRSGTACPLQAGVVTPLSVDGTIVGAVAGLGPVVPAGALRAAAEVARFISTQLELAELDRSRRRAAQAELRFLRAQISPHFLFNAITAIESFVRTDPERARTLLVQFADFTRYSFRSHDQFVTVAEELELVDTYLELERARFGDRLAVTLRVAPEVLSVRVPALVLQTLVENAVRHGLEPKATTGHLAITATDEGSDALICVEDDGVGADPARVLGVLSGRRADDSVGLHNVDERLRAVFGDHAGLVVETAVDAGTKVSMRVPKFHAAVGVP